MTEDSRTISRLRRMIHKVLIVAFALTAMQVLPIQAQESRTIKVGCIDIEDFLVVECQRLCIRVSRENIKAYRLDIRICKRFLGRMPELAEGGKDRPSDACGIFRGTGKRLSV